MRPLVVYFILVFVFFATSFKTAAQSFEGKIKMQISYINLPEQMKQMEEMPPVEIICYYKGSKSRTENVTPFSTTVSITDSKTKTSCNLISVNDDKVCICDSTLDPLKLKESFEKIKIAPTTETKKIGEYNCKKYALSISYKSEANDLVMDIWLTEEISVSGMEYSLMPWLYDLKGFPMEYVINQGTFSVKTTVVEVLKESVPDSLFGIPQDYKQMTQEEFQKLIELKGGRK